MQKLFIETGSLDRRCYADYGLSEDLLMEHAAWAMAQEIRRRIPRREPILIVAGSGNNGADGIALARMLQGAYEVRLYLASPPATPMGVLQLERAQKCGVGVVAHLGDAACIVDALFGSGLSRPLEAKVASLIKKLNAKKGFKLACDLPSGLDGRGGVPGGIAFRADLTVCMGALKEALFSDAAKEIAGEVVVADLGVSRHLYETEAHAWLLEEGDLHLPHRLGVNVHKGSFGHLAVFGGEKRGAAHLAALAALGFGAGLVSVVGEGGDVLPPEIMASGEIPQGASAVALGMGAGKRLLDHLEVKALLGLPLVVDADVCSHPLLPKLLEGERVVLTPHPKEFSSLLGVLGLPALCVEEIQADRFGAARHFVERFPHVVLLLKGANPIIALGDQLFVNPLGLPSLAKGGSGDVLSGMIGALLAQGWSTLDAAVHASLAHALASRRFEGNSYALTPLALIEEIGRL